MRASNAPPLLSSMRDLGLKRLGSMKEDGGDLARCRQFFTEKTSLIILGYSV